MNKSDLVTRVSVDAGISKREAGEAVDSVLGAVQRAVAKGEKVTLPGFGTFEKRKRAARTARNPQTGTTIKVPATSVPAFKPGQGFKDTVGGKKKKAAPKAAAKKKTTKAKAKKR